MSITTISPRAPQTGAKVATIRSAESDVFALVLLSGLFLVLIFAVLAFGAVQPWAELTERCAVASLFAVFLVRLVCGGKYPLHNPSYIPLSLLALLPFVELAFGITAYRQATLDAILTFAPCAMAFVVTCECTVTRRASRIVLCALGGFGGLYSLFAVAQCLSGTGDLYWFLHPASLSAKIFGSYVNHNHYAGLMEMIFPAALVASLLQRGARRLMYGFFTLAIGSSIVLSQSRGGLAGFAAELLLMAVCLRSARSRIRGLVTVGAIAVASLATALWLGQGAVANRMTDLQDAFRWRLDIDCLRMWRQHPLVGFGLGAFASVYPQFRSFYADLRFTHAHNDWLEFLVETGLVGAALLVWFLVSVLKRTESTAPVFDWPRGARTAAVCAVSGLLVHSLFDFNLHIPANALLFFALCGIAAQREGSAALNMDRAEHSPSRGVRVTR